MDSVNGSGRNTVVMVVGSLGDLIKKLIETDLRIEENPKDRGALLESAALRNLVANWPLTDDSKANILWSGMRMSVMKYRKTEKELEELITKPDSPSTVFWMKTLVKDLFQRRNEIRRQMAELNKLCSGVGKASAISTEGSITFQTIGGHGGERGDEGTQT